MPPKRKVPARRASAGNRVSFDLTHALSGRPRRESTVSINYKDPGLRVPKANVLDVPAAPIAEVPKKRGRPSKSVTSAPAPTKTATSPKVARGRPKAATSVAAPAPVAGKRKRVEEESAPAPDAKRRGRPPKAESIAAKPRRKLPVKVNDSRPSARKSNATTKATTDAAPKKKGRPPGALNKVQNSATSKLKKATKSNAVKSDIEPEVEDFPEGLTQEADADLDEQYWLMKAEPETRIENGRDVAFPIDKLAQATDPEPWDGMYL